MTIEIVQIVQELSTTGGVESVAYELARAFSRAKIVNTVLASAVGGPVSPGTAIERIGPWLSRVPTRGIFRYLGRFLVVPTFTILATRAVLRYPKAVVISHGDSLKGDVLIVHAVNAQSLAEKRSAHLWLWLLNPMHLWVGLRDRWMIGGLRYRMYVAVSPRVATELQEIYHVPPTRIRVIPNGIDLDRFARDTAAGLAIRREFGIPADAKLLLFAGHEFRRKGLAHAIGALERLGPDVWLLVVGSDNPAPYRKMAATSAGRLVFAGSRTDMPALYAAADGLVLPTSYETFSLVCMEAMACSLPVFATPVGGIEDYLVNDVNGYQIRPDADDIASRVAQAFADPELTIRLREGARATALNYGWDHVGSRYIELLEQVQASKDEFAHGAMTVGA
ncbi:MAG: glycosyl transferase, group 1 [Tardiphaga sp.]|jgi:glycosyltransferase involved in cell wall biosynthesis|uniref:glycosyltransferase family 4 protein n=1 Tax=Tardiphaga sp. TaxID=1926292 RepID=UPI0026208A07|nr:glycosyltransferase family 4 protein [Tardiphaga sp.]MDB5500312.1 glycosyl transferase, group 1 [Tardiphaga sp.]